MQNSFFLAIDAGTGSGRAALFDSQGCEIGVVGEEWSHASDPKYPGSMSFDTQNGWALICRCVKSLLSKSGVDPKQIAAVSASSMREGIVLYDKEGCELWAVANVDARAQSQVEQLVKNHPELEKKSYELSGQTFALGAIARLLWVKENEPAIYERTTKISMISDWVLYKLCGVISSDPSNACTAGIFSLNDRAWASQLAVTAGLKSDIFPDCVESGTKIGEISAQAAQQTGLSQGMAVVMGGGDVQLGAAGLGVVEAGQSAVLGGTFWQQIVNIPKPLVHPTMDIRVNAHVVPGLCQAEAITFFVGTMMRWFRDAFCEMEKNVAKQRGMDVYTVLEEMARDVPVGAGGLMPIFSDEMRYGRWYHASPSLVGLSLDAQNCGRAHIFRALQENACIVSAINLQKIMEFTGVKIERIIFAAGASKGFLWPKILSDATGLPVQIPVVKEATALGCAMAAAIGVGRFESFEEAAKAWVRWEKTHEPDMRNHEQYKQISKKWQAVYTKQRELVESGLCESMWKAPGVTF